MSTLSKSCVCSVKVASQTKQLPATRRRLHTHSLSPAGRPCQTPSPAPFSSAASMPSIYTACSVHAARSTSSPSGCRRTPPAVEPFPRPKPLRPSPPGVARRLVTGRTAGTCRGAVRPVTVGLERTQTFTSIKTAVHVTADNQTSFSRIPISSGLHKAIADEVSQQVTRNLVFGWQIARKLRTQSKQEAQLLQRGRAMLHVCL